MEYLPSANEHRTVTKSSTSQAREEVLSVHNGVGQFFPVVFDYLDYIDCDRVKSHQVTVSTSDELAYNYPIGECTYYTDKYVYVDENGTELRVLPHWAGEGFYRAYYDRNAFVNFDDEAFGTRNKETVQIGLTYTESNDTIE